MQVLFDALNEFHDRELTIPKRVYSVVTLVGYAVIVGLTWPFSLVYVLNRCAVLHCLCAIRAKQLLTIRQDWNALADERRPCWRHLGFYCRLFWHVHLRPLYG